MTTNNVPNGDEPICLSPQVKVCTITIIKLINNIVIHIDRYFLSMYLRNILSSSNSGDAIGIADGAL